MENEKRIIEVFVRDKAGKRVSCGKHETPIDGNTLDVEIPDEIPQSRRIEIAFLSKDSWFDSVFHVSKL